MKSLVLGVCSKKSLHDIWLKQLNADFLFVTYEDHLVPPPQTIDFERIKGSKFNIVYELIQRKRSLLEQYDYIFIPDDDIYIEGSQINHLFALMQDLHLHIAQPSILGWISIPLTAHQSHSSIRYTNWVEIMCPCFSREAFWTCEDLFNYNKSNWGIENLWFERLGKPKDKVAVIDDIVATHTRPCFHGDTYNNNNQTFQEAYAELETILKLDNIDKEKVVYSQILKDFSRFDDLPSEQKFIPNCPYMMSLIRQLHERGENVEFNRVS
jgi:hypothetical protein